MCGRGEGGLLYCVVLRCVVWCMGLFLWGGVGVYVCVFLLVCVCVLGVSVFVV